MSSHRPEFSAPTLSAPHEEALYGRLPQQINDYFITTLEKTVAEKLEMRRRKGKPDPRLSNNPIVAHQQLLAALLGQALLGHDQQEKHLLDAVERVRALALKARRHENHFNSDALEEALSELRSQTIQATQVGNAFRLFLTLSKVSHAMVKTTEAMPITRRRLTRICQGQPDRLSKLLAAVTPIRIVTTMHPTDMANPNFTKAINILFRHYKAAIKIAYTSPGNTGEFIFQQKALEHAMERLLQEQFHKAEKPTVEDEIKQNLTYFTTLYIALPRLRHALERELGKSSTASPLLKHPLFTLGTWVGGDMDGNTAVVPNTLETALLIGAIEIARLYRASLKKMIDAADDLGFYNLANDLGQLRQILNTERITLLQAAQGESEFDATTGSQASSQARALERLALHEFKCLPTASAFKKAMSQIFDQLQQETKGLSFEPETQLKLQKLQERHRDLASRIETFGFHFASVDIRQDAAMIHRTLHALAPQPYQAELATFTPEDSPESDGGLSSQADSWQEEQHRVIQIYKTLLCAGPLNVAEPAASAPESILPMFQVARAAQAVLGEAACQNVILSLTRSPADVFATMVLLKQAGLLTVTSHGAVKTSRMDITPLFEKAAALKNAPRTMAQLFSDPVYQSHLACRQRNQLVMLGFSDGIKDAGLFGNAWLMYKTQRELIALAESHNVTLAFYYGRGGNPIRGGGSTERAIHSLAVGAFKHPHHLTEQGEVLARYYSIPEVAEMRLGEALMAILDKAATDADRASALAPQHEQLLETLAESSKQVYQQLLRQDHFLRFYDQFTPNETRFIHRGSRGSTRYSKVPSIENVRAIPWVFQWTQARVFLPGWYGVGSALQDYLAPHPDGPVQEDRLATLVTLYQTVPFFKNSMDNCALTLHQADFNVARYYFKNLAGDGDPDFQAFMNTILAEYQRTHRLVSQIVKQANNNTLNPWETADEQEAWRQRQAYMDPLHVMQVQTLQAYRASLADTDSELDSLEKFQDFRELFTIASSGIAAGVGTTG